jgi:hypothetical protein
MKIIKNEKLIKRNSQLGMITSLAGAAVLVGGFVLGLRNQTAEYVTWLWTALLVGFLLTQVGFYFTNRWGRKPSLDEQIDTGLKGLSGEYSIYHYMTPADHVLVGPAGVWVLLPMYQTGTIIYSKNRFRQKSSGLLHSYMRIFGQEGIGRPELQADGEIGGLQRYLAKNMGEDEIPEIKAALVFTSDKAVLETEGAPIPAMPLKKIKDYIRKQAKEISFPKAQAEKVTAVLPE